MKTDSIIAEMLDVKEGLGRRFGWDPRAICGDLIAKQCQDLPGLPLVGDLGRSLDEQAKRIAGLPPPPPAGEFLPEDPIVAEVRRIRRQLALESQGSHLIMREEPPSEN